MRAIDAPTARKISATQADARRGPATWPRVARRPRRELRLLMVGLLIAAASWIQATARGGEFDRVFTTLPGEIDVENPGPPVVPTIYVVGIPDRTAEPVRKTRGLVLNGQRLTEDMLSESVLILRPDGTGRWGYHTGFDIFREPQFEHGQRIDPRTLVEYDKWRFDPLEPVRRVGADMNLLRLFERRPLTATYRIAFGPSLRIRTFRVSSNCDSLARADAVVHVRLFADPQRTQLIAAQTVGQGQATPRFPVEFSNLDHSQIWLQLSADASPGSTVDLYYTLFEAELDTRDVVLPELATGTNRLVIQDDAASSHQARICLRWVDRPAAPRIWEDFEDGSRWSGCQIVTGGRDTGLAFTGQRFARASFPANGRDYALNRSLPALDLTMHNRLGAATRVIRAAPMRAILLGIKDADGPFQYVRPRPGDDWNFQTFDISGFRRQRVTAMNLYWAAQPGFERPDDPCVYDVDSLCLWHEDPPTAPSPPVDRFANYVSPNADRERQATDREIPPIQDWLPLGIYDGICSRSDSECRWLFDQMRRLHMNTVYVSNGTLAGLERVLPLAEARGIRLVYQGSGEGSLYYEHLATPAARRQSLERTILPRAAAAIPPLADRWGLAAWSLTEEISPDLSRELADYYALVRRLAPNQPPTVLHNNLRAAEADLATNHPLVITHDCYPFFWSPRNGPSNPHRSITYYRNQVRSYAQACRRHGARLWVMPQAWGTAETASLDPPNYGYRSGMRTPEPGEIKLQGWVAIAEGATGIMFYAANPSSPGERQLWDADWTETANTRAAGELFAQLAQISPILCDLQREDDESDFVTSSNPQILAHCFARRTARPGAASAARYIVLASLDGFASQRFDVAVKRGEARVYDLAARRDVTDALTDRVLSPGSGGLWLVGDPEDYAADCQLIEAGVRSRESVAR